MTSCPPDHFNQHVSPQFEAHLRKIIIKKRTSERDKTEGSNCAVSVEINLRSGPWHKTHITQCRDFIVAL